MRISMQGCTTGTVTQAVRDACRNVALSSPARRDWWLQWAISLASR